MQGKSCFSFRSPDAALFQELSALTKAGLARMKAEELALPKVVLSVPR